MGVLFSRAKLVESVTPDGRKISTIQEYVDESHPELSPITAATRITDEGKSQKISVPFTTKSTGDITTIEYKTVWQPIGQQGWIVKVQSSLKRIYTDYDEIAKWLTADPGQVLLVRSNHVNSLGEEDEDIPPYERLEPQSLWFIDKITIVSRKGNHQMADMELGLVRCWQT